MKRTLFIILAVVAVFLVIGFSLSSASLNKSAQRSLVSGPSFGMGGGGAPDVMVEPAMEEAPAAPDSVNSGDFYSADQAAQQQERMVIENADLAIVVKDPKTRMAEISKLANDLGGYVVSSNLYQSYTSMGAEVPEASVMIRIPSEKLDEALAAIKKDAVDIQYENRSGQDVTNVYIDLKSQLKAKEAAEKKLLEIMEKAEKAEDVLAIYLQVQTVQSEIEVLKGQIKYYEESAALSSVNVRLIAEEGTQPIEVGPWKPQGAAKDAVEDLIRFLQGFAEFLIRFVIYTLPALILIAIPLFLVYLAGRAVYRRFRKPVVVEEKDVEKK